MKTIIFSVIVLVICACSTHRKSVNHIAEDTRRYEALRGTTSTVSGVWLTADSITLALEGDTLRAHPDGRVEVINPRIRQHTAAPKVETVEEVKQEVSATADTSTAKQTDSYTERHTSSPGFSLIAIILIAALVFLVIRHPSK